MRKQKQCSFSFSSRQQISLCGILTSHLPKPCEILCVIQPHFKAVLLSTTFVWQTMASIARKIVFKCMRSLPSRHKSGTRHRKTTDTAGRPKPWMVGDERGEVGETPLHLAVLCNSSPAHDRYLPSPTASGKTIAHNRTVPVT
jgi:hypothetical protein